MLSHVSTPCKARGHTARQRHALQVVARAARPSMAYKVGTADGKTLTFDQDKCTIGSRPTSDVVMSGPKVAADHAVLERKGRQLFCKALVGEEMWDASGTWVDGSELRPRVSYLLGSGVKLAFGTKETEYVVEFDQASGANPLLEMMVKGMVANSSSEVKQMLDKI